MSLSFVSDGVTVGTQASALYAALDAAAPTDAWKEEILKAFQTWAVNTNVDIGLVADGGQPLGALGLKQGDARFGDIRITAISLGSDVLAAADPYDPFVANTWVGDVFLNSANTFGPPGSGADFDLFSVMLHEAGHVFGLSHSADPTSPMFSSASSSAWQSLTAADIGALQSLYGVRSADAFDEVASNDTLSQATPLSWSNAYSDGFRAVAKGDISTLTDVDHFQFSLPQAFGTTEIRLHTAGVSLLTARVSLLDSAGQVIASQETTDPLNNDLLLSVAGPVTGESYFIRIEGARSDVFGIGGYELSVCEAQTSAAVSNIDWTMLKTEPTADEFAAIAQAAFTPLTTPGYVEHTYYEEYGSLNTQQRSQVYRVRSADIDPSINNVYTVLVKTTDVASGHLKLRLLDEFGRVQNADILQRENGVIEVQISSVASNRDYFIEISSDDVDLADTEFEITVDFDQDGGHLQTYVSDSLQADEQEAYRRFVVFQSGQFHFVLSASDYDAQQASGVQMTVRDSTGQVMAQWSVGDGQARAADFFFKRGVYLVEFTRLDESSRQPVVFKLAGLSVSDPIGPQLRDTVLEPVDLSTGTALTGLSSYWLPFKPADAVAAKQDFTILGFGAAARSNSIISSGNTATASSPSVVHQLSHPISTVGEEVRHASSEAKSPYTYLRGSSGRVVRRATSDSTKQATENRDSGSQLEVLKTDVPTTQQPKADNEKTIDKPLKDEHKASTTPASKQVAIDAEGRTLGETTSEVESSDNAGRVAESSSK